MSATDRAVDPKHYVTFHAARRWLKAAGSKVERTKYNYSLYFVFADGKQYICDMWAVIEMAEKGGMK